VEIFVIENQLPASVSRGVADYPHRRVGESPTPCIAESGSRLLNFLKEVQVVPEEPEK
jgi:hypothetical protein